MAASTHGTMLNQIGYYMRDKCRKCNKNVFIVNYYDYSREMRTIYDFCREHVAEVFLNNAQDCNSYPYVVTTILDRF